MIDALISKILDSSDIELVNGRTIESGPAANWFQIKEAIANATRTLNQWHCSSFFAHVFKEQPWIGGLTIRIRIESEYNDEGGTTEYAYISVKDIYAQDGATLPEALSFENQEAVADEPEFELDEYAAQEWVQEKYFEDMSEIFRLAVLPGGSRYEICVNRTDFEDLLATEPISGKAVCQRIQAEFEKDCV